MAQGVPSAQAHMSRYGMVTAPSTQNEIHGAAVLRFMARHMRARHDTTTACVCTVLFQHAQHPANDPLTGSVQVATMAPQALKLAGTCR